MQNDVPFDPRLTVLVESFRRGEAVVDWAFDAIYPDGISLLSSRHWTPLDVAHANVAHRNTSAVARSNSG